MAFPHGVYPQRHHKRERETRVFRVPERSIRLDTVASINNISRQVSMGKLSAKDAYDRLIALRSVSLPCPGGAAAPILRWRQPFSSDVRRRVCRVYHELLHRFPGADGAVPAGPLELSQPAAPFAGFLAALWPVVALQVIPGKQESLITGVIMPLLPGLSMTNAVRDTIRGDDFGPGPWR